MPADPSGGVVVVGGEYGNSFWAQHDSTKPNPAIVRAFALREMVDRHATLAYFAGNAIGEDNLNISPAERKAINGGSLQPIADRWRTVLDRLPNHNKLTHGTAIGPSLGATVLSHAMQGGLGPVNSSLYVEAPNVVERSSLELGKAFMTSGPHLRDNVRFNDDPDESTVVAEHLGSLNLASLRGVRGMGKFASGLLLPTNRALLNPMRQATLENSIRASLARGESVVHAWGTKADVSPAEANREIRDAIGRKGSYASFEFGGEYADHSLTNVAVLVGALARHAAALSR